MPVFVTSIGVISAIGNDVPANLEQLAKGRSGLQWSDEHQCMLGRVQKNNEEICRKWSLTDRDISRTSLLGLVAAGECWGSNRHSNTIRTGLISATSAGGLDRMEDHYFRSRRDPAFDMHALMTHDNGRTTERIAAALGFSGFIGTVSTACSSGANAIMQGARLIEGGRLDRVLAGGADPFTIFNRKGFGALMVYDPERCKPFDAARKGMNLGEGAGFLLLENEHSLSQTGNTPLCMLSGWHNATDAYHQTASSPTGVGATLTMQGAIAKAGITPEHIGYINAHGTGTGNNDLSESYALQNVFGLRVPPFSSTKAYTGHTLAAAGAIEAVFCILSLLEDVLLPNLNFFTPMPETGLRPQTTYQKKAGLEYVLSNSFGFGGNCTSLVFNTLQ